MPFALVIFSFEELLCLPAIFFWFTFLGGGEGIFFSFLLWLSDYASRFPLFSPRVPFCFFPPPNALKTLSAIVSHSYSRRCFLYTPFFLTFPPLPRLPFLCACNAVTMSSIRGKWSRLTLSTEFFFFSLFFPPERRPLRYPVPEGRQRRGRALPRHYLLDYLIFVPGSSEFFTKMSLPLEFGFRF